MPSGYLPVARACDKGAAMAELGNIFDDTNTTAANRGPDLRVVVDVDIDTVRAGRPVRVYVPLEIDVDGQSLRRVPHPADDGASMELNLPSDVPDGTTLRLRGRGAAGPGGLGDLYLTLHLTNVAPIAVSRVPRAAIVVVAIAAVGAILGALASLLLGG